MRLLIPILLALPMLLILAAGLCVICSGTAQERKRSSLDTENLKPDTKEELP